MAEVRIHKTFYLPIMMEYQASHFEQVINRSTVITVTLLFGSSIPVLLKTSVKDSINLVFAHASIPRNKMVPLNLTAD